MTTPKTLRIVLASTMAFSALAHAEVPVIVVPDKKAPTSTPAPPPAPRPQMSGISIRIDQPFKTTNEGEKKTVKRSLKIFVSNSTNEAVELKLKYVMFGRDLAAKEIKSMDEGQPPASVPPKGTVTVETLEFSSFTTEPKTDPKTHKRSPGTGVKYLGYGVQVFKGETLVAEAFDPLAMKDSWGKTVAAPK